MENKEFAELLNKFYAHGLLKEVYRSKKAIVCNAFDQFYIAFALDLMKDYTDTFPGFSINTNGLRYIVEDDTYVLRHFQALSDENQDKTLVLLNEKLLQFWLEKRSEFEHRPPKVDLEFEQEVMAKGKNAIKQEEKAPSISFSAFGNANKFYNRFYT